MIRRAFLTMVDIKMYAENKSLMRQWMLGVLWMSFALGSCHESRSTKDDPVSLKNDVVRHNKIDSDHLVTTTQPKIKPKRWVSLAPSHTEW